MEMVSEVNFKMLRSFQDHLGPFEAIIGLFLGLNLKVVVGQSCDHSKRPQEEQKSNGDGFRSHLEDLRSFGVILGPFWDHSGPICGPKFKIVADQSCDHSKRPQEEQNSDGDGFRSNFEDIEAISGTFLQFLGHFGVIWCHSRPQNDLNVLKLSLKTIIICILLLLRSF